MNPLAFRQPAMIDFAKIVLPNEVEIWAVLQRVTAGPQPALELVGQIHSERQSFVFLSLAWLLKLRLLRVCS